MKVTRPKRSASLTNSYLEDGNRPSPAHVLANALPWGSCHFFCFPVSQA